MHLSLPLGLQQQSLQQLKEDNEKQKHINTAHRMTHNDIEVLNVKIDRLEKKLLEVSELFNDIAMPFQVCCTFVMLYLALL